LLEANDSVGGFSAIAGAEGGLPAEIDGREETLFGIDALQGSVLPPYIAGRPPQRSDEIALGAKTLHALRHEVGDRVDVSAGGPMRTLLVTGELVLTPRVVNDAIPFGEGAVVTTDGLRALGVEAPVNVFLVRFVPGTDRPAALQRLRADFPGSVLRPSRPADLENLRRVDGLPSVLAALFAVMALLTVGHTLVSSVRRRSRDLAILRAMGFVRRQVAAAVAWQATIVAMVALAVGLPLGAAAGRWSWTLITDRLGLPRDPVVPGLVLLVLALLTLATANVVSVVPGLLAARTRPVTTLHSE
jgi:predicted lysophospholipase L1 biosynthesis ABC-type transport system permease subunit